MIINWTEIKTGMQCGRTFFFFLKIIFLNAIHAKAKHKTFVSRFCKMWLQWLFQRISLFFRTLSWRLRWKVWNKISRKDRNSLTRPCKYQTTQIYSLYLYIFSVDKLQSLHSHSRIWLSVLSAKSSYIYTSVIN